MIQHVGIILPCVVRLRAPLHRLLIVGSILASSLGACVRQETLPTLAPTVSPTATASPTPTPTATPTPASPTPTPTATPCGEAQGRIAHDEYPGVAVPGEIPLAVYFPPCYAALEGELPAVYLLHGYPFDEDHWLALGAARVADELILSGRRAPFLMILPRQPEPLFRSSDGGPGSYESELLEGVFPHAQAAYRAADEGSARALSGISRGGVWALEVGFRHPEAFAAVGAMSPALAVNSAREPYDPLRIAQSEAALPARLMLLAGEQDWAAAQTRKLAALLADSGRPYEWLEVPGDHSAGTWELGMLPMLEFLTQSWQP